MVRAGEKAGGKLGVLVLRLQRGQQAQLHLARHGEVVLQALLLLGDALVEPGVFDGDGDLRGERGDGALVVFVEVVGAGVLDIEHADDFAFVDERHGHLRARLGIDHDDSAHLCARRPRSTSRRS